MASILISISTWLHTLATIVMVGYFFFARLIYLPELENQLRPAELRALLERTSARLKPYFGAALLAFAVSGFHLMLVNPGYLGLGSFTGNRWSVLITLKHVLVGLFLVVAFASERRYLKQPASHEKQALESFKGALGLDLALGLLVLLLTAFAQAG